MTEQLDWSHRGEYIRTRSLRKPGETDIEPAWADEAYADRFALVAGPDPASRTGRTDRLVGYSPTALLVITVIYMRVELIGVNAWKANAKDARRYWEAQEVQE